MNDLNCLVNEKINDLIKFKKLFMFTFYGLIIIPILANATTLVKFDKIENGIVKQSQDKYNSRNQIEIWRLTKEELKRYHWLMENTASARWYKDLDPPEVLALNAKDLKEMMRFAKIQAHNIHDRVTKELEFNLVYSKAYKSLYPNEKPVVTFGGKSLDRNRLRFGDRIWLFVGTKTPLGHFIYQNLIKIIKKNKGVVLDIYFVGKDLENRNIQSWAEDSGIIPNIINTQVTLNYGNVRFQNLSRNKKISLPFIGIVHDSHFQPIELSSVL